MSSHEVTDILNENGQPVVFVWNDDGSVDYHTGGDSSVETLEACIAYQEQVESKQRDKE